MLIYNQHLQLISYRVFWNRDVNSREISFPSLDQDSIDTRFGPRNPLRYIRKSQQRQQPSPDTLINPVCWWQTVVNWCQPTGAYQSHSTRRSVATPAAETAWLLLSALSLPPFVRWWGCYAGDIVSCQQLWASGFDKCSHLQASGDQRQPTNVRWLANTVEGYTSHSCHKIPLQEQVQYFHTQ